MAAARPAVVEPGANAAARARRGPPAGPRPEQLRLSVEVTPDQLRDFERCARAAGVALEDWILQCAAVQAANALDALQTDQRRRRALRREANEERAAYLREHRAKKGTKP